MSFLQSGNGQAVLRFDILVILNACLSLLHFETLEGHCHCFAVLTLRGIQAFDFIGSGSTRIMLERDYVYQKISKIVQKYEDKSGEICETCGCEGIVRTDLSWIQILCDTCYSKCVERDKKK